MAMLQRSSRCGRVISILLPVIVFGSSVRGFAQQIAPQTMTTPPVVGAQAPAGPSRQLSVDEAVRLALEQNLGVQAARINPRLQDLSIAEVRSGWIPTLTSSLATSSSNSPVNNIFAGASSKLTSDAVTAKVGLNQLLPGGGSYSLAWDANRQKSNNVFSTINPAIGSDFSLSFSQPLVRNFRIDDIRQQLLQSKKTREIIDVQLRQTVLNTTRNVKHAYWDLSYAISSLAVQRESLELAQQSLHDARAKVTIGTMAPIDVIEAQAEVAAREEAVIVGEAAVDQAEDSLRALILDPKTPDFWTMKIELTDQPTYQSRPIDIDAAVKTSLEQRTDVVQARKSLEQTDISIRYYQNQMLPDVSVQARYSASAQGGTQYNVDGYPNPVITLGSQVGYGAMLRSLLRQDFPAWTVGVQVGYPLGKSNAEIALARARLQREQSDTEMRNLELQIVTQVRNLGRQVNTNAKRVEATRVARELAERKLEAEQKKLAAGISTSFLVFQAQRDLAQARNAELSAILDYSRSLVDFEIGQQTAVGG
jgi:outer membrane protein TolC